VKSKEYESVAPAVRKLNDNQGDLNNQELKTVIDFYSDLLDRLRLLSPTFDLAKVEVARRLELYEEWQRNRKNYSPAGCYKR
jgi:hypothetical protein